MSQNEQYSTESESTPLDIVQPSALEAIERASIDMQISTAKRYPRKLSAVKDAMLSFATLDEETASSCFYTLPRGGKTIQGPSIRLAEIALSCYRNIRSGARVLNVVSTGDTPHVIVQAVTHDLENNVAITIEKRRRITKKKNKPSIDEDDINLACNACIAIALRDAAFKVVPLALIKPVFDAAKRVAIGEASTLDQKRQKILDRFKQMNVQLPRILAVVDARKIEDIDLEKLGVLIGLGTAIKDGETTIDEAFPPAASEIRKPIFADGNAKTEKPEGSSNPDLEVSTPAAGSKPEENKTEGAQQPSAESVPEREPLIGRMKESMLDHEVSESKLFKYAQIGKMIPEGVDELWAIPTEILVKLALAIPTLSTKSASQPKKK